MEVSQVEDANNFIRRDDGLENRIENLEKMIEKLKIRDFQLIKSVKDFLDSREEEIEDCDDEMVADALTDEILEIESLKKQVHQRLDRIQLTCDELKALKDGFNEVFLMIMDHFSKKVQQHIRMASYQTNQNLNKKRSDDFVFKYKLGFGGFGDVHMVTNKIDQINYALKEIKIEDDKQKEKILREVELLSGLNHPNIVRYYTSWIESGSMASNYADDSGNELDPISSEKQATDFIIEFAKLSLSDDQQVENVDQHQQMQLRNVLYIQMELCTKNTLRHAIATQSWFEDNDRRKRMFCEIVAGLTYIHENNIIHRDLKPGNIFLSSNDQVKIGDFGLAMKADFDPPGAGMGQSSQTRWVGTILYMAPEVNSNIPGFTYTHKVDVFALGIIFFEMYYPLHGNKYKRLEVLNDLREPEINKPNDISKYLSADQVNLLISLLQHEEHKRPSSIEIKQSPFLRQAEQHTTIYSRTSDFDFKNKIGSGGFGTVHRAIHKLEGRDYAIKIIKIKTKNEDKIHREVKLLSELNHPNVVQYYTSWIDQQPQTNDSGDGGEENTESEYTDTSKTDTNFSLKPLNTEIHRMCIQMELCKHDLKAAISSKFWFKDSRRRNKLFVQIAEGLTYIHGQNIIHRDLKPENIFLNSNDQVKIGDFGLATKADGELSNEATAVASQSQLDGTYAYMAPEIGSTTGKQPRVTYTQKVDIYSLGIIFFEMCYPLKTGMERAAVLTDLRTSEIRFPIDFCMYSSRGSEFSMLKMLLNHTSQERPTSAQILENPYVQSMKIQKIENDENILDGLVVKKLTKIFQLYEAVRLFVPFNLISSCTRKDYERMETFWDAMKTIKANVPKDLRLNFADYVLKKEITELRRYSIEKINLDGENFSTTKSIYECVFDIVACEIPLLNILTQHEVLQLLFGIVQEFPCFKKISLTLRLNHVGLLKGLLIYYEIPSNEHKFVLEMIAQSFNESFKLLTKFKYPRKKQIKVFQRSLSSNLTNKLASLMTKCPKEVISLIKILKFESGNLKGLEKFLKSKLTEKQPHHLIGIELMNEALQEMESVLSFFQTQSSFDSFNIKFSLFMFTRFYSGLIFQLEEDQANKGNVRDIIALGGRYDGEINSTRTFNFPGIKQKVVACGVSISIERLTQLTVRSKNHRKRFQSGNKQKKKIQT